MDPVERAQAVFGTGLVGNANRGGRRQVTVIEAEVFESLREELKAEIHPSVRRANLMVSGGLSLQGSRGKVLRIGSLRLQIAGETRPCERMDEAVPGLRAALDPDWRGGVYGFVLNSAEISVGDTVAWDPADSTELPTG
jgi:MOSC domain-containing protein YiiM